MELSSGTASKSHLDEGRLTVADMLRPRCPVGVAGSGGLGALVPGKGCPAERAVSPAQAALCFSLAEEVGTGTSRCAGWLFLP